MKKVLLIVNIFFLLVLSYSFNIKEINSYYLGQKSKIIAQPFSFFANNKGDLYLIDRKDANIKIFDNSGKLIKIFGRKGVGPNEFLNPIALAKHRNKLVVYDFKRRFLFLFKTDDFNNIRFIKKINFGGLSFDFKFMNKDKLLISGMGFVKSDKKNRKSYNLYLFNINNNNYDYLLDSITCFGVKNQKEVDRIFINKINYLSVKSYSDFTEKYFYYVHSTDLKIIRINRKDGNINMFGKQTKKYIKPTMKVKLKKAIRRRKHFEVNEIGKSMSFVIKLFCIDENKIGLLYTNYNNTNKGQDIYMQIYDVQGKFIKEFRLLQTKSEYATGIKTYYKKNENILYILSVEESGFSDLKFKIHKFKITD